MLSEVFSREPVLEIGEQVAQLKKYFPLSSPEKTLADIPDSATGWYAIPNIWKPDPALPGTYAAITRELINLIMTTRGASHNYRDGELYSSRLEQIHTTEMAMYEWSARCGGEDILYVPAQLGSLYVGKQTDEVLGQIVEKPQFGLCLYSVCVILLTHSEWHSENDELGVICSGSTLYREERKLSEVPAIAFRQNCLYFGSFSSHSDQMSYGVATGFL